MAHRAYRCKSGRARESGQIGTTVDARVAVHVVRALIAGSPLYLGPEVWRDGVCSRKSDVWSLGCVVYELMTHLPPFEAPELAYKVLTVEPRPLPSCYNEELRGLVTGRMLRKEASGRPSAEQLVKVRRV